MSEPNSDAVPFPVRRVGDGPWEVLVEQKWIPCETEEDARSLAKTPVFLDKSMSQKLSLSDLSTLKRVVLSWHTLGLSCYASRRLEASLKDLNTRLVHSS